MNNSNKKIAVVGAGYWGKNLVRVFNELGFLKIVCDSDKAILEGKKAQYPGIEITKHFSEVLKDKDIKAVVIATPATVHYSMAKEALLSGKDVFVEKPLALEVEQGRELVELAKRNNLILMVGHILHYHPAILKLKEMISRKELGEIRYIWSTRLNLGKLRKEENVLWSFAPHDISVIIDILGLPQKVSSKGKSYIDKNIHDVTLSILEFKANQSAHIFVSWLNPFKEQKFTVIGSEKMAVYDGVDNKLVTYFHKVKNYKDKDPEAIKAEAEIIKFSLKEPLIEEAKHFMECIEKRSKPITDGEEGLRVLEILEVCQKSL